MTGAFLLKKTEKAITWLQNEKFLDDARFAGFFARDKFRFNALGKKSKYAMLCDRKEWTHQL